jgi:hypothetical protein
MDDNAVEELIHTLESTHQMPYMQLRTKLIQRHGYWWFARMQHQAFHALVHARWAKQRLTSGGS